MVSIPELMRDNIVLIGRKGARGNGAISIEPIILDMGGGRYVGPLLPDTLAGLVSGRRSGSSSSSGSVSSSSVVNGGRGGGAGQGGTSVGTGVSGVATRAHVCYEVHLLVLSLQDR